VTILLDLPDGAGLERISARGEHDRIERSGEPFHARVAQAFRTFAGTAWQAEHPECGPVVLVDARGSQEEVADRIWKQLHLRWPETFRAPVES